MNTDIMCRISAFFKRQIFSMTPYIFVGIHLITPLILSGKLVGSGVKINSESNYTRIFWMEDKQIYYIYHYENTGLFHRVPLRNHPRIS